MCPLKKVGVRPERSVSGVQTAAGRRGAFDLAWRVDYLQVPFRAPELKGTPDMFLK